VTVDNVITLLFAGFDTTSSSITYMLAQLAEHPEILEKVRERQRGGEGEEAQGREGGGRHASMAGMNGCHSDCVGPGASKQYSVMIPILEG
jgi:cytochrome P450